MKKAWQNLITLYQFNRGKAMKIVPIKTVKNKNEARLMAVDWQVWASEQSMSYSELSEWNDFFTELARKFNLIREFKENGII